MTNEELQEFNDFVTENPIRNNFLPILNHITSLKPKSFEVTEFNDKEGNTTSIHFYINKEDDGGCSGRVSYDNDYKRMVFEFAWDEENYWLLKSLNEAKNFLTIYIKKIRFDNPFDYKKAIKTGEGL